MPGMTLPLEVSFWNMRPEPNLIAAVKNELHSIRPTHPITSCRVRVLRSNGRSASPSYDIQIVMLSGSRLLRAAGDSPVSRFFKRLNARWSRNEDRETVEPAL